MKDALEEQLLEHLRRQSQRRQRLPEERHPEVPQVAAVAGFFAVSLETGLPHCY